MSISGEMVTDCLINVLQGTLRCAEMRAKLWLNPATCPLNYANSAIKKISVGYQVF